MLHQPAKTEDEGTDLALHYRMRTGVLLFLLYAFIYLVFVVINLVSPLLMESIVLFGMNLAVTYGIGLILFAVLLALIYNRLCAKKEIELNNKVSRKEEA